MYRILIGRDNLESIPAKGFQQGGEVEKGQGIIGETISN